MAILFGTNGADNLIGTTAADTIFGAGGNDNLNGLGGNDALTGGGGNDVLTGGGGNDQFIFNIALPASGIDTINDFVVGSDKIVLDKSFFLALETLGGNVLLATDFKVINSPAFAEVFTAATSAEEIVYNTVTGNLFYNADAGAAGFGLGGGQFAKVVGAPATLSNTDIGVIA